MQLIHTGRLPIYRNNVELIQQEEDIDSKAIINEKSADADLTIIGIRPESIKHDAEVVFGGYDDIGDVLFVYTGHQNVIR